MMRVFRQRNFAPLWTAGLVSLLGDWAFYTVVPVFVLDQTGSVFLAGLVWAVIALPSVVVGPLAGVCVDRWDRPRIMLWGNLAQTAAVLVIGGTGAGIWVAMTVVLINASLAAIILPAKQALLPTLVREEDLGPANALNAMNDNLARIVGPPVGAVVYTALGIEGVAVVNAALFLAAALLVRAVGHEDRRRAARPERRAAGREHEPFWTSLRTGARVVRHRRLLGAVVLLLGMVAFADGPLAAMIAPFVDTTLGKGAEGVGTFATIRGVAGILGGIVIGRFGRRVREDRVVAVCAAMNGLGFAAMALAQDFAVVACAIVLVVIGPTHIGLHTTLTALLQHGSEDAHRGRVFALAGAVTGALFLIGTVGGSAAGASSSPSAVIVGSGLLFLAAALATMLLLPAALPGLPGDLVPQSMVREGCGLPQED